MSGSAARALALMADLVDELIEIKGGLEGKLAHQVKINSELLKERDDALGALAEIMEAIGNKDWDIVESACREGLDLTERAKNGKM